MARPSAKDMEKYYRDQCKTFLEIMDPWLNKENKKLIKEQIKTVKGEALEVLHNNMAHINQEIARPGKMTIDKKITIENEITRTAANAFRLKDNAQALDLYWEKMSQLKPLPEASVRRGNKTVQQKRIAELKKKDDLFEAHYKKKTKGKRGRKKVLRGKQMRFR